MIKLSEVKSLNDLPENIRGLFAEADGAVSLDETKVRTEEDVANVQRAKQKERDDANAARAMVAEFKKIGATPQEIADRISELESRSASSSELTERIANLQRELRQSNTEKGTIKTELDTIKPEYEKIKGLYRQQKTDNVLTAFVKTLRGVDTDRLARALKKDVMLDFLTLDESGEGLICKDGSKLEDYAMNVAKDFGFTIGNTPDQSNPGTPRISPVANRNADNRQGASAPADDILDSAVADALKR